MSTDILDIIYAPGTAYQPKKLGLRTLVEIFLKKAGQIARQTDTDVNSIVSIPVFSFSGD